MAALSLGLHPVVLSAESVVTAATGCSLSPPPPGPFCDCPNDGYDTYCTFIAHSCVSTAVRTIHGENRAVTTVLFCPEAARTGLVAFSVAVSCGSLTAGVDGRAAPGPAQAISAVQSILKSVKV